MILKKLSILNYKNIREATLELSPKMNCFIGENGVGKTNVLDAVYYLSFCRSATNPVDSAVIRHDEPFCMIEGCYADEGGRWKAEGDDLLTISVGMKRGTKKHFKRNKKDETYTAVFNCLKQECDNYPAEIIPYTEGWNHYTRNGNEHFEFVVPGSQLVFKQLAEESDVK